jgi:ArsR family transcriptional regulator, lead/cadmium/zinc/bismuth-responsive transcriptional repressor
MYLLIVPLEEFASPIVSDTDNALAPLDGRTLGSARSRLLSPDQVTAVADVFKLLGDPTRVRILDALTLSERCVCDLAELLGLSESAVSHQLRLLRGARLVRVRRAGRQAHYSLDDHHVIGVLHDTRTHVEEHENSRQFRATPAAPQNDPHE